MPAPRSLPLALALVLCACGGSDAPPEPVTSAPPPLFDGLGDHGFAISTTVPGAQQYFDQGLALTYGFNHPSAVQSFRWALELDPQCAMCAWGVALALGPNINAPMDRQAGLAAFAAVQQASELIEAATADPGPTTARESSLIAALSQRYAADPPEDRSELDAAYANAMGVVASMFPDDDDIAVLHAESQLDLSPWDYWEDASQPRPNAAIALAELERVMARNERHAGACHYYIHAVEAMQPERGIPCAERLADLMPGAGHIVHMPAHIFVRVGRYADAIDTNVHAAHADAAHLEDFAPDSLYRIGYVPHNHHFRWFAASMAGSWEQASDAANQTAAGVDPALLSEPGLATLQHYVVTPLFTMVRFGRWQDIRAAGLPAGYPYVRSIWHYARGMAAARTGDRAGAAAELSALGEVGAELQDFKIWEINSAATVLEIASASLGGEVSALAGDFDTAVRMLQRAVELEAGLLYDEPPTWHLPVRQQLGAVLLQAGRAGDAEKAYREDLAVYRDNGWSLLGLAQALEAQGRDDEAAVVRQQLAVAWRLADVDPPASRF